MAFGYFYLFTGNTFTNEWDSIKAPGKIEDNYVEKVGVKQKF